MIQVGAASTVINGKIGTPIQGAGVNQCASRIRDDLEANALLLKRGDEQVMLVSCDHVGLDIDFVAPARKAMAERISIPERNIIITCTHQHSGPSVILSHPTKPIDSEYLSNLKEWLVELAAATQESLRPARIGYNSGSTTIGYNRRVCYFDGTHAMLGDVFREDFAGIEGPEDNGHYVLCAIDEDDKPLAILQANTAHPTNFYGRDFFSADYPGVSRAFLRNVFGNIPVLFLNGAQGDIDSYYRFCENNVYDAEQRMLQQAHLITGETLRQIYTMKFHEDVDLKHTFEDLQVDVRLPSKDEVDKGRMILQALKNGDETVGAAEMIFGFGAVELHDRFSNNPIDLLPIHAIRIGELAIATQPCELYCHFGLQIKRRSPFEKTVVCGLADGYNGYCPTVEGIIGGGHSGKVMRWARLSHEAGYRLVDCASKLLREIR